MRSHFGGTPLWPAGHLPLKGGDRLSCLPASVTNAAGCAIRPKLLISPLEGEMAGRPEGGVLAFNAPGASEAAPPRPAASDRFSLEWEGKPGAHS
jgi:hypothetical protein